MVRDTPKRLLVPYNRETVAYGNLVRHKVLWETKGVVLVDFDIGEPINPENKGDFSHVDDVRSFI